MQGVPQGAPFMFMGSICRAFRIPPAGFEKNFRKDSTFSALAHLSLSSYGLLGVRSCKALLTGRLSCFMSRRAAPGHKTDPDGTRTAHVAAVVTRLFSGVTAAATSGPKQYPISRR